MAFSGVKRSEGLRVEPPEKSLVLRRRISISESGLRDGNMSQTDLPLSRGMSMSQDNVCQDNVARRRRVKTTVG